MSEEMNLINNDDDKYKKIHEDIFDLSESILGQIRGRIKYCEDTMELKTLVSSFKDVAGIIKVFSPTEKPKAEVNQMPISRAKEINEQLSIKFENLSESIE